MASAYAKTRRVAFAVSAAAALCLFAETAHAQGTSLPHPFDSPSSASPGGIEPSANAACSIDPSLRILERVVDRAPPAGGVFAPDGSFDREGVDASLRFESAVDHRVVNALERLGVQVLGDSLAQAGLVRVRIPWAALEDVTRLDGLVRAEALWQPAIEHPLEETTEIIGAKAARLRPPMETTGEGTRIGLIDTGVDILHPALFRADAGYYAWLDVDEDGRFEPGTDAVDLDGDGEAGSDERLRVLDATVIVDFDSGDVRNADQMLDARRDWVYADMNDDGTRNAGHEAGFSEDTPAYGEALFVVDDADRNGVLDPGEKLVRLGTSKVARYRTQDHDHVRGEDLIDAASESADAFHGTGVGGVLVGGQAIYHDRVGLAPGADLYVYGLSTVLQRDNSLPLRFVEAAVDDDVDVLLHEWTNAFTQPMDGTTNFEAAMSAAREQGLVHVNPVGNLNRSKKHRIAAAQPGSSARFTFVVDEGFDDDGETLPYQSAFGSLQWTRAHPALELEVTSPNDDTFVWSVDGADTTTIDGATLDIAYGETDRGSGYIEFYLQAEGAEQELARGEWTLALTGFSGEDDVWGRVTDEYSNWRPGIRWTEPTVDRGTAAFPSTAEAALGVGAFAGRGAHGGAAADDHELRPFSGRGPSLDGRRVVSLAAPDDPFVPLAATPDILDAGWGRSWFTAFAGTSGAAPHVAGTVALMLAASDEDLSPGDIEQRLVDSADASELVPAPGQLPGQGWGYGRLDAYGAIYDEPAPVLDDPPVAVLEIVERDQEVRLDASASEPSQGLEYRFDTDYDGRWDTEWTDQAHASRSGDSAFWARLEVRTSDGQRHGTVAYWPGRDGGETDAGDAGSTDAGSDVADPPEPKGCCTQSVGADAPVRLTWACLVALVVLGRRWARREWP